jgi:hypothetical protein
VEELTGKIKRLCRIMHDSGTTIAMRDNGRSLGINWPQRWTKKNRSRADELQQLVYADDDLLDIIGSLPDGVFGAMQLWTHYEEVTNGKKSD